jgi:hypothetical protein
MKEEKVKKEKLARLNSRIRIDQQTHIKSIAKKFKISEGKVLRTLIDKDMDKINLDF